MTKNTKLILVTLFNLLIDFAKTSILVAIISAFSPTTINFDSLVIIWACTSFVKIYFKNHTQAGITITIS